MAPFITDHPTPDMHLQGRRWMSLYSGEATYRSYGIKVGDRASLLAAVPQSHKDFLTSLPWVLELPGLASVWDHRVLTAVQGFVFVHAGLEGGPDDGYAGMTVAQQLELLRNRVAIHRPEMLCGRDYVLRTPQALIDARTTVVSGITLNSPSASPQPCTGHHHTVHLGPYRIIMDESGGLDLNPLSCIILPSMVVLSHTGAVESYDPKTVWTHL